MKTNVIILSAFMALLTIPSAMAADPGTVDGTANVTLGTPLTVTLVPSSKLDFGTLSIPATAGTCVVDPASAATYTGGVSAGSGTPAAIAFDVTGKASATYAVTVPGTTVVLTSGIETVSLSAFTASAATGTLSATGKGAFTVGATLALTSTEKDGVYTGTFPVTVAYN